MNGLYEMLLVVSIWCGQPVQVGTSFILKSEVNNCRARLITCLDESAVFSDQKRKCFLKEKL